ncbi:MAG: alkaline phosphatase D family protein [Planctomycetota bacterium]
MTATRLRPFSCVAAVSLAVLALVTACASTNVSEDAQEQARRSEDVTLVAFGSCAREDRTQEIWDSIVATRPDAFLFIGDNVYVDIPDVPDRREQFTDAYAELAAKPGWQELNRTTPVLATWDDHDFGKNDAGAEWELKEVAQEEFLDFFGVPADSPRRARKGVYHAETMGDAGRRVQVILLDTRYHRTPLREADPRPEGLGPYAPDRSEGATLLGEEQWVWLEQKLKEPAELRIVASSIQVVADEHGWECWGNLPAERERLYDLIESTGARGVMFISGDRHLIEISRDQGGPYPLWDFTSSGFNWGESEVEEPNRHRLGPVLREPNFGTIAVDWSTPDPTVTLTGHGLDGRALMRETFGLGDLAP